MRERRIRKLQGHPKPDYTYVLGGDPSGGTGNDDAAIIGLCIETLEQVYAFNDNTTNPVEYGYLMARTGKEYNEAYLVCEANNHGLSVHPILEREYTKTQIFKRSWRTSTGVTSKYGFMTTNNTKQLLVGAITDLLDYGLTLYDRETTDALLEFEEDDKGKIGGEGDHLVIALGMAAIGVMKKGGAHLAQVQLPDRETHKEKILRLMNENQMVMNGDEVLTNIKDKQRRQLGRFRRQVA